MAGARRDQQGSQGAPDPSCEGKEGGDDSFYGASLSANGNCWWLCDPSQSRAKLLGSGDSRRRSGSIRPLLWSAAANKSVQREVRAERMRIWIPGRECKLDVNEL